MHYTVHYDGLEGVAKQKKALEDITDYMGADRFAKVTASFRNEPKMTLGSFAMLVSFAGVQGYPVKA